MQRFARDYVKQSGGRPILQALVGLAVFATSFVGVISLSTTAADAYPVNHTTSCAFDKNATFDFVGGVPAGTSGLVADPWTTSMGNNVRAGINSWDYVRYSWGSYIFTTTEASGSVDWKIYLVSNLPTNSSYGGLTNCEDGYIILDFKKSNGTYIYADSMKGLASHEFGHAFDLLHTGYQDSWYHNDEAPTMESGCSPMQSSPIFTWPNHLNTLEDDDYAYATSLVETAVNPNASFEYGSAPGWKKYGGTWTSPSGGPMGYRYLTHTGEDDYVINQVTLYDPNHLVPNDRYRTAIRYKEPSGQNGVIRVELYRRLGSYPTLTGGSSCSGQFANDQDLNSPSFGSNWIRESSLTFTRNPTTGWSGLAVSPWKTWSTEGIYLQIRVTNETLKNPPFETDGTIHIDSAYIQEG